MKSPEFCLTGVREVGFNRESTMLCSGTHCADSSGDCVRKDLEGGWSLGSQA